MYVFIQWLLFSNVPNLAWYPACLWYLRTSPTVDNWTRTPAKSTAWGRGARFKTAGIVPYCVELIFPIKRQNYPNFPFRPLSKMVEDKETSSSSSSSFALPPNSDCRDFETGAEGFCSASQQCVALGLTSTRSGSISWGVVILVLLVLIVLGNLIVFAYFCWVKRKNKKNGLYRH